MTDVPEVAPDPGPEPDPALAMPVLPEPGATTRALADEERAKQEAEALAAVGPLLTLTVVLQVKTGELRVKGPTDPIIALGMLEMAKHVLTSNVNTSPVQEKAESKIVVPAGMPLQFLRRRR